MVWQLKWGLGVVLLAGCNYHFDKQKTPQSVAATYESVYHFVLQPKCLRCHSGPNSPKGIDLFGYESTVVSNLVVPFKPLESQLFDSVLKGRMPKGQPGLPEADLNLISRWIEAGALKGNVVIDPAPPPKPPKPTYQWISEELFQKRCVGCHDGSQEKVKLDLRTYESLMAYSGEILKAVEPGDPELSALYDVLSTGVMPPSGPNCSSEELAAIRTWISNGANLKEGL